MAGLTSSKIEEIMIFGVIFLQTVAGGGGGGGWGVGGSVL